MFEMTEDSDAVRQEYDRLASEYDHRWRLYIDATLRAVLNAVSLEGTEDVLDVPCGTGELERSLLSQWPNLRITGADISPGMLREATGKDVANKVTWMEADVRNLPVADHQFDWIICANSFHYFRFPVESLMELRRTLRPNGKFLLVDWCDDYLVCKLCSLWLRLTDPAFYRTYSLRRCHALLQQAGFQIVETKRFRINLVWGLMRFTCRVAAE
jgi:ubiquinone/menaquinone biosynthesis C-methylase UbiE